MPLAHKYGIISDIHANLAALKAAFEYLDQAGAEKIICLGDLVGYGGSPFECIQAVRARPNTFTIAGNHDRQLVGDRDFRMRRTATQVLDWTAEHVSAEDARYLAELPHGLLVDDAFVVVHGSLLERDAYVLTQEEVEKNLAFMRQEFPNQKVCFFGHTHVAMLIGSKTRATDLRETRTLPLDRGETILINPGSVGQPRDRCPLAAFGLFDADQWTMTFVRRPYDIASAQKAITDHGLPEKFARRLAVGV